MKRIKLFTLCLALLGTIAANAQDIHFSQFYQSPLNLNPALTGVMNCNQRLTANFRNQWAAILRGNAYNTYSASYDQRVPVGRYDYWGVGGTLWGDKVGSSNFKQLQAKISGSYSKRMGGGRNGGQYLVVGMDAGIQQRSVDFAKLQWGIQNNGNGGYDPSINPGESFDQTNRIFADLTAGLLWFNTIDEDRNFYIGGAYHHINRANVSFAENKSEPLNSRFTIHAGGEFMLADRFGLVPNIILMQQGKSLEINPGTSMKFVLSRSRYEYEAFQLGAWVRLANKLESSIHADALILTTRFDYNNFNIGFSYDATLSSLKKAAPTNGSFEFSILYKICGPERRNVYCPNF